MIRNCLVAVACAGLASMIAGCDASGGAPYVEGSQEEATVKGTVKVKGKLMPGGTLHFSASNSKRMVPTRDAQVGPDGSFSLTTYVGQNIVTLTPPRKTRADMKNRNYYGLEYADKFVDVKPGEENSFDLDLTP